ncbi:MAG TPA: hypothetical protein VLZ55_10265 [Rhodanobacter sp.]|nr:hypothetical protein [Rhodanobacter sp.]
MSRYISALPLLVLVSALGATSAFAAQSAPAAADHASQNATAQKVTPPVIKPGDATCLRDTGSLIRAKPGHCLPVTGRSYSGEELRRTGTQNTARALQTLDPSITVGH